MEVNLKLADELKEKIENCRKCSLWRFRKKVIVGEGPIPSDFFFLGQNPGKMENELGRPLVGRAGKYLDKLLSLAGLSREEIYLTGAVRCPTPRNRRPTTKEIKACSEFLKLQLKAVNPKLIVAMGGVALEALQIKNKVTKIHGKILEFRGIKVFVTFHPSAAMRFPKIRKHSFEDFKKLRDFQNR
jgi:DNA polymerase